VGDRPNVVATQRGPVGLRRAYYRGAHGGQSAWPHDQQVGRRAGPARARVPAKRAGRRALIPYVENQDDRFAYDRSRAPGSELGSGRVAAAGQHVVSLRRKPSGLRGSAPGSKNMRWRRVA